MSQKSAFEVYSSMQKAGKSSPPGNTQKKPAANTRPQFVVPSAQSKPKKRKQPDAQAVSGNDSSDYEPVSYTSPNGQLSQTPNRNGINSTTPSNGKKSKKSKRNALNGGDAVAGPSTSNGSSSAKKRKASSTQNGQHRNDAVQVISDSPSSSSSRENSPSPAPSPSARSTRTVSGSFSGLTDSSGLNANHLESNSIDMGCEAFKYILSGTELKTFMSKNWEKSPLLLQRMDANHYDRLNVSRKTIDEMLRNNEIEYTKNLDVTLYENGVRQTFNPDGRAYAASVWQYYAQGCSIRLLNPQTYMRALQKFNAELQEYFHCMVGANIYLTPPNSQGFAPHYDDIEAFVLQIEGKKEWLLYPPRNDSEKLPRESSPNFQENEIGEPAITCILEPGDMLYFPRGWIHQARTVENEHSLHITLSVYQKNAFADLFEEMMKQALDQAINSDNRFRQGLPIDIWHKFGYSYAQFDENQRRQQIRDLIITMFQKIEDHLDIDDAVDKMAMKFQHDALPPVLSPVEKEHTSAGTVPRISPNGAITMPTLRRNTQVRILRANIVRLVKVNDAYHLFYYSDNSKEYHANDLNFLEVDEDAVGIIRTLIWQYPKYTKIRDLTVPDNLETALAVTYELWDRGLLMTNAKLKL